MNPFTEPSATTYAVDDPPPKVALLHGIKVVYGVPPNYDDIVAVLPSAAQPNAIFTYGDTVYMRGPHLDRPLAAHESIHIQQQAWMGAEPWWDAYLVDLDFRYAEELTAHRAEINEFNTHMKDRNIRARYFNVVALRLCGPLYGRIRSQRQVMKDLRR